MIHDQMKNPIFHIYRLAGDSQVVDDRRIVGLVVSTVGVISTVVAAAVVHEGAHPVSLAPVGLAPVGPGPVGPAPASPAPEAYTPYYHS